MASGLLVQYRKYRRYNFVLCQPVWVMITLRPNNFHFWINTALGCQIKILMSAAVYCSLADRKLPPEMYVVRNQPKLIFTH